MSQVILSSLQQDALNEVGNIGAGNASTALSIMTNQRLSLSLPHTEIVPLAELPLLAWESLEAPLVAVYVAFGRDATGCLFLLFSWEQATGLCDLLGVAMPAELGQLEDMERSAVAEVGNIVASSYLNALAGFTGLLLLPEPPGVAAGMGGAILGSIAAILGQVDDECLMIHLQISSGDDRLGLRLIMVPQQDSLQRIFEALGL